MMNIPTPPSFARGQFHKSTYSGQNPHACVEVARSAGWVAVRDSKQSWNTPADHHLVLSAEAFDAFLAGVRNGEFGR